jgi:hypothetical protein
MQLHASRVAYERHAFGDQEAPGLIPPGRSASRLHAIAQGSRSVRSEQKHKWPTHCATTEMQLTVAMQRHGADSGVTSNATARSGLRCDECYRRPDTTELG